MWVVWLGRTQMQFWFIWLLLSCPIGAGHTYVQFVCIQFNWAAADGSVGMLGELYLHYLAKTILTGTKHVFGC